MTPVEWIERYDVPNGPTYEGWAVIHIDSKGFFGAVSDYGNYAFHWRAFGRPFKEFLAGLTTDYLCEKLSEGRREYDGERSLKRVKQYICHKRRKNRMTKAWAAVEWAYLKECQNLATQQDFTEWSEGTALEATHEFACHEYPQQCLAFCQKTFPRFVEMLLPSKG